MGAIATILPLVLEALKLAPTLVSTGAQVVAGAQQIWTGVTSDHVPTTAEQAQYDAALATAQSQFEKDATA